LLFLSDEGGVVLVNQTNLPGISNPVAFVALSERGRARIHCSVVNTGQTSGHASTPAFPSTIGILAEALKRVEQAKRPAHFDILSKTFDFVFPYFPFYLRYVISNLWIFSGLLDKFMSRDPRSNAVLRTTLAPTLISASSQSINVLPTSASVAFDVRTAPGEDVEEILEWLRNDVIRNPLVRVDAVEDVYDSRDLQTIFEEIHLKNSTSTFHFSSPPISSERNGAFGLLARTVVGVFPEGTLVAPFLQVCSLFIALLK
jgi:carboxypeptidase PM20D1